jgi:RNA methyltransferase, TrmH family
MISKNRIRFINMLSQKKQRIENNRFIIEGEKMVNEAIQWVPELIESVYVTSEFEYTSSNHSFEIEEINEKELKEISSLTTPNKALAVCKIPENKNIDSPLILCLDGVQDPGNMGTILRLADWFGIKDVVCSKNTVDCYNPKVLQATMGAIFRVNVHYVDLSNFLSEMELPIYGALLDGENIFENHYERRGIVVLGNEGNGISDEIKMHIQQAITIPRFGEAESLNVATAGAIILGAFYR